MKKLTKGLLLTAFISAVSLLLNKFFLSFIETLTIGIILGLIIGNVFEIPKSYRSGIDFALKKMLKWGIVLLGVKLNFSLLLELGPKILILIIIIISLALVSAFFIGKSQHLNPKLSILLGVGSSICGASAIVAMGPVIDAEDEDVAISVTVISILGAIGVLIYTFIGQQLSISDLQYGIWSGSSLQGVAHALAAAGSRGSDSLSLEIGTLVKMARVAMLGPVAIVLGTLFSGNKENRKTKFPVYVLCFILVGIVFTLNDTYELIPLSFIVNDVHINIIGILKELSNIFILMAMVAMGLKVNFKSLESNAIKALLTCSLVFIIVSTTSFILIHFI